MKSEQYDDLIARIDLQRLPRHIAVIMDGNGRWATSRHLPRSAGHRAGMESVRRLVEICRDIRIPVVSVYAFSTENWKRPLEEVGFLMKLFIEYLHSELALLQEQNIQLGFLGKKEGLPVDVVHLLEDVMEKTASNDAMRLNLAINYGGRDELTRAMQQIAEEILHGECTPACIDETMIANHLDTKGLPDPDLLIRPSGEQRLSNFLLWQLAYSEFYYSDKMWPDFGKRDLLTAILNYQSRNRRFGKI